MKIEMTGSEKVLFKATLKFAMEELKLSEAEATEKAMAKIMSTRAMAKKLKFRY